MWAYLGTGSPGLGRASSSGEDANTAGAAGSIPGAAPLLLSEAEDNLPELVDIPIPWEPAHPESADVDVPLWTASDSESLASTALPDSAVIAELIINARAASTVADEAADAAWQMAARANIAAESQGQQPRLPMRRRWMRIARRGRRPK